jgi:molecular chaperone IbpA
MASHTYNLNELPQPQNFNFTNFTNTLFTKGIGWEPYFTQISSTLNGTDSSYPPVNVIKLEHFGETTWHIEMALAGFTKKDLEVTVKDRTLTVKGKEPIRWETCGEYDSNQIEYPQRGIKFKSFERNFVLSEHVTVDDSDFKDGLLTINLKLDLPKELQPKAIKIN